MKVLVAGLLSALMAMSSEYIFNSKVFYRFRRRTPETWRNATARLYAVSLSIDLLFGYSFTGLFRLTRGIGWMNVDDWQRMGALYGFAVWFALILPVVLWISTFVKLHRGFVIGNLTAWLVNCLFAGLICAFLFRP